ncbi:unnamed protein product [Rangifer tarandus platyrhynchus]|uniref:Uncharacterized protein n=1 Tax=Rangifer tarandus platyrhynchus TaxID=3082113 RepID=A0AC59Z8L7_RANTA
MLFPVLATQGTVGALICVVVSSLGLLSGPLCDTGSGGYTYAFRKDSLESSYLPNQPTWATYQETEHAILRTQSSSPSSWASEWGKLFSASAVLSADSDIFCSTCVRKGQIGASRTQEFSSHIP